VIGHPTSTFDAISTNPPFGGMEENGIEDNFPADIPHPRDG
jgi:type I restriction-modification system DNA methylase subunit